jgi:hypothetical protein
VLIFVLHCRSVHREKRDDRDGLQHAEQIVDARERRLGEMKEANERGENDENRVAPHAASRRLS